MSDRRKLALAVGIAAVLAVLVGFLIATQLGGSDADTTAGESSTTSDAGGADDGSTTDAEDGKESTTDGESPDNQAASRERPENAGIEVIPEVPGQTSDHLPGLDDDKGKSGGKTSETPLPDRGDLPSKPVSTDGGLVAGYPAELLPVAPDSTVVNSSVSPSDDRVQVAMVANRGKTRDAVLRFYRLQLTGAGFSEVDSPAIGGADSAAFERDGSTVVVTLDPDPARSYSVYATLIVGKG